MSDQQSGDGQGDEQRLPRYEQPFPLHAGGSSSSVPPFNTVNEPGRRSLRSLFITLGVLLVLLGVVVVWLVVR